LNLLVTPAAEFGLDDTARSKTKNLSDIAEVISRLNAKLKDGGDHRDTQWSWADLGMCEFLRRNFALAEEAYRKAAERANTGEPRVMLDQLTKIEERWPPQEIHEQTFYMNIHRILA